MKINVNYKTVEYLRMEGVLDSIELRMQSRLSLTVWAVKDHNISYLLELQS